MTPTQRAAMTLARDWIGEHPENRPCSAGKVFATLTRALAEQPAEQEPVASIYITPSGEREFDDWRHDLPVGRNLLYTAPQPTKQPLTDDEFWVNDEMFKLFARAIERAHGITSEANGETK